LDTCYILVVILIFFASVYSVLIIYDNSSFSIDYYITDSRRAYIIFFRFFFIIINQQIQFVDSEHYFSESEEDIVDEDTSFDFFRLDLNKEDELFERDNTTYIYNHH
jgi:hypothetical protein